MAQPMRYGLHQRTRIPKGVILYGAALACAAIILVALAEAKAEGVEAPATQPAEAVRAATLVRQLDDADPQVRRRASMQLNSLGGDALPVVVAAEQTDAGPERRRRLQAALKFLRPRAEREQVLRERSNWEAAAWREAYEKAGRHNPTWDLDARRAIELYLQTGPDPMNGTPAQRDAAIAALEAAVVKRCDDPLIESLHEIMDGTGSRESTRMPYDDVISMLIPKCLRRDYPPSVKLQLIEGYMRSSVFANPQIVMEATRIPQAIARLPGLPKGELDALAQQFFDPKHIAIAMLGRLEGFKVRRQDLIRSI